MERGHPYMQQIIVAEKMFALTIVKEPHSN